MSLDLEKAKKLIIHRANQLVEILVTQRGNDNPPFSSEEYLPFLGIKNIEKRELVKAGGILIRNKNNSTIIINKNDPLVRQNFSCAHELGHLLFSELKLDSIINTIEHRTFNPQAQRRKRSKAIEKLCDEAATELLMPTSIFQKHLNKLGTTMYSIERLAELFKVSIQSAAIRVSETSVTNCIVSKWILHKIPLNSIVLDWPKRKMIDNILFSPSNKIIDPPSILHDAYNCNNLLHGNLSFRVGKKTKSYLSEIKGFGYGENRYVISLTFING